jgi:hypothetical protein
MPRLYAISQKPKIASNSKVKILTTFVKHLSDEMCCKPASSLLYYSIKHAFTAKVLRNQGPKTVKKNKEESLNKILKTYVYCKVICAHPERY